MQLVANILYSASTIFLVAVGFSLIFTTARFFHFAHAAVIVIAPYAYYLCTSGIGMPQGISVLAALLAAMAGGWLMDRSVYRPMRKRGSSPLMLLLASLGLYIIIQNVVSLLFGDDTKMIAVGTSSEVVSLGSVRLTLVQCASIVFAIIVLLAKRFVLDKSRRGLMLRAVADSPYLAEVSGIDYERAVGSAFGLGSLLAGSIGLIHALDVGMTPTMGLPMLLMGVVAVIVGGSGMTIGAAIASLMLAAIQQIAGWQIGIKWEETAAFLVLMLFLLWRPYGIVGKSVRKATV